MALIQKLELINFASSFDLISVPLTGFRHTVWFSAAQTGWLFDGLDVRNLTQSGVSRIDYEGIYDAAGIPLNYNSELRINPQGVAGEFFLLSIYFDREMPRLSQQMT